MMKEILKELERLKAHYAKASYIEYDAGVRYGIEMSIIVIKNHLKKMMGDSYTETYGNDPLFK